MSSLQNKIDFVALVSVTRANSNGDPLNGNRPRTDLNGFGEISDVCIKRKIRNRMQDLASPSSFSRRIGAATAAQPQRAGLRRYEGHQGSGGICPARLRDMAGCACFGQVFAFKGKMMQRACPAVCAGRSPCIRRPACPRGDRVPPDHQEREW